MPVRSSSPNLSREAYLELGVEQPIFSQRQREQAYNLFAEYLQFMGENDYYDSNMLSHQYRSPPLVSHQGTRGLYAQFCKPFVRLKRGHDVIDPALQIRVGEQWRYVCELNGYRQVDLERFRTTLRRLQHEAGVRTAESPSNV